MKERLNEIIEKKGLTATKFATMIDVNPSAISHLLKGRNKPGYDVLVNIARAFPDISMDWLLTGKGNMYGQSAPPVLKTSINTDSPVNPEKKSDPIIAGSVSEIKTAALPAEVAAAMPSPSSAKKLKRIILFFEDGSFEDYLKN